jgi:GH25 family lysozyme M1 (1,4-beta-N-acetylmuramidase)
MTKTKQSAVLVVLGVVLAVLIGLIIGLNSLPHSPAPTAPTTEPTTETTLPPPTANVFTPKDFAYEGDYLTCITDESILGIDVSTFQKQIDWQQVKAAGIEFVMIRIGYRGTEQGLLFEDEMAQTHYQGAKSVGLKVGGYFFSQSITPEEAAEEARFAMDIVRDWELDMPLVYDWEYIDEECRSAVVDTRMLTDCTKAFCETVDAAGYDSMVYFNPDQSRKQMYLEELVDYGFWLAMYSDHMTYEYKVDMWQYTCTGSVPGIDGNVDINLFFPYE